MKITLKAARVNANLSREQAAFAIGVRKETIANWETGAYLPNVKYLPIIEGLYGIPYDELLFSKQITQIS